MTSQSFGAGVGAGTGAGTGAGDPGDATPRVIAIVVAYNSAAELPACLASLEAQRGVTVEIHVVDNASSDTSAELVRRNFPRARLTVSARNLGFAGGNNLILERERAPFYALVNPDAVLAPDAVAACVARLERDRRAGIAATRLVNPDGSLQPSCHAFLGLRNLLGEAIGAHHVVPGVRSLSSLHMPLFGHDRAAEVDWIQGAFLVVREEIVRTVGGFDPDFFMYGEEMDWCRRARDAGWTVVFLPEPPVVHLGGASSEPMAGPMFVENLKGRLRFLRKHRGPLVAALARALIAFAVLVRFVWREAESLASAAGGRPRAPSLRRRRTMFRAALGWVLRGLPLSPPLLGNPGSRP
ncbi:MAG TPA: glycosyltransferase family 2 protein [Candidatus Eisenbacteria bacterium]|nr:glycosyltransferase family 2 protein [Candidatus Eisenbacteria bacterium]